MKKKQRRNDDHVAVVAEVVAVATTSSSLSSSPSSCSTASTATATVSDPRPAAKARNLRVRPALTADVERAPPWMVVDNFVSEQVTHEHVSVVQEPDHADSVQVTPEDAPPPTPPVADSLQSDPLGTVASPSAPVSTEYNTSSYNLQSSKIV